MTDPTLEKLLEVVGGFFAVPAEKLTAATTADDVDGWDSVAHAMLVLEIEDAFGVAVEYGEALEVENLGEFSALLARKRQEE